MFSEYVANRDERVFGWEIAHEAVNATPAGFPLHDAGGYTYDVGVWDLFIIQGPIFCRAVPNPNVAIRNFCIAVERSAGFTPWEARGVARPA